jgi:D-alanine-D-alanine ligase-like ATP-grasp enzyme
MPCTGMCLQSATSKFMRKKGYFDLFGFDFMVTSDSQLKLIEVNTNPALSLGTCTHNHVQY